MHTGLLWFEADGKKPLTEIVKEAALYFRRKFNRAPDLCLVNPQVMSEPSLSVDVPEQIKVLVKPWRSVLPKHIWIGYEADTLPTEGTEPS